MAVANYAVAPALPLQPGAPAESAWLSLSSMSQQQFSAVFDVFTHAFPPEARELLAPTVTFDLLTEPFSLSAPWMQGESRWYEFSMPVPGPHPTGDDFAIKAIQFRLSPPTADLNEQAKASLREYARFYGELSDGYAEMVQQTGRTCDAKLDYARTRGMPRLAELAERVNLRTTKQLEQLNKVLMGHRQITASTTDLAGRGALLVRFPEDIARRLERLHLLRSLLLQPSLAVELPAPAAHAPALAA